MYAEVCASATELSFGNSYQAETGAGTARLTVLGSEPARHAVDAAIVLGRVGVLLDEIEAWLGDALSWRWIPNASEMLPMPASLPVPLQWSDEPGGPIQYYIELPWGLLRHLPAPPDTLQAGLVWPEVPVVLSLAQFDITPEELARLELGGAVVLPDSLEPHWRGVLRAADPDAAVAIPLEASSPISMQVITSHESREIPCSGYEICLVNPTSSPIGQLLGWSKLSLELRDYRASLRRRSNGAELACCLALGQLIPWGVGYALAIDAVCDPTCGRLDWLSQPSSAIT